MPLNPFEADVRDTLEARDVRTRPQFGACRCRIDLVAMHPDKPGWPVLAIECEYRPGGQNPALSHRREI
jgi:hypothetical protein